MRRRRVSHVETPLLESARHERLEHDVKPWQQLQEQGAALVRLEVQCDERLLRA